MKNEDRTTHIESEKQRQTRDQINTNVHNKPNKLIENLEGNFDRLYRY